MSVRLSRIRQAVPLLLVSFFVSFFLTAPTVLTARAAVPHAVSTTVNGVIAADTTWSLSESPYRVGANDSVVVASGAVLTVEPGVVVEFEQSAQLRVEGALEAIGTAAQPIRFTSVNKSAGSWDGLIIWGASAGQRATAHLAHTIVEYGGIETPPTLSGVANLEIGYADVVAEHLLSRESSGDGLLAHSGTSLELTDADFENNGGAALRLRSYMTKPLLSRLTATGNGVNATVIGGDTGITGTDIWEDTGIPYVIAHVFNVYADAVLQIEPGVEVQVASGQTIVVEGSLLADGTAGEPIRITGVTQTAGSWQGIQLQGDASHPPYLRLNHATVEYGGPSAGNGANIRANLGTVHVAHSTIQYSAGHGIYFFGSPSGSVVESSQIIGNAGYGILNPHTSAGRIVVAANNWWGAASGPTVDDACNPGGQGSRVSAGVVFQPYLTSASDEASALNINDAYLIILEPHRWFATADGVAPVTVDITVVDGTGEPVPGQLVRLRTSLGIVEDGGITDAAGRTRAILRSAKAGEAEVFAEMANRPGCAYARSSHSRITFTTLDLNSELLANARAPYLNEDIAITPLPVTRGVPTTLRATITNPNAFPIEVEASFGFAQAGIGLAFDPVGAPETKTIAADSSATFEVQWTPVVSGHYCVEVVYSVVGGGLNARGLAQVESGGRGQRNLNVYGGSMITPSGKNSLRKGQVTSTALDDGNFVLGAFTGALMVPVNLIQGQLSGNILDFIFEGGGGIDCAMQGGTNCSGWQGPRAKLPGDTIGNLAKDPPSQDYRTILTVEPLTAPPLQPGDDISPALTAALNNLVDTSMDVYVDLFLAAATYDRYAGAAEAGSLQWASVQSASYLLYLERSGHGLIALADSLDALLAVLDAEGIYDVYVEAEVFAAYQSRLATQGYSPEELEAAWIVGLNDEALEQRRQRILSTDPATAAGSLPGRWQARAGYYREVGKALLETPGLPGQASRPLNAAAPDTTGHVNLLRLYDTEAEIQIANPLAERATIDLRYRTVNMPPEWTVDISPHQVTLDPGAEATVRVTVRPGSAALQNSAPSLAVEGYAGGQLLGGVAVAVNAPRPEMPQQALQIFLPSIVR